MGQPMSLATASGRAPIEAALVHHDQHGAVLGLEFREELAELGFGVGQALVEGFLPGRGDGGGVVFALADVQAEEDVDVAGVDHVQAPPSRFRPALPRHRAATSTLRRALPARVKPVLKPLISGPSMPPGPVTPPPGSSTTRGKSCRTRRPEAPLRDHEKGNCDSRPAARVGLLPG